MAREQTKMITSIGGQALMEGVMMRGPKKTSVAVRLPDETIDVEELKIKSLRERYKWLNWPFIRGVIAMYESMTIGFKALGMSADKSLPEDEEEAEPSKFDQWMTRVFGENAMNYLMVIAGTLGVLIAIGLFFFLPALSFNLIYNYTGIGDGFLPWRSTFEGVIRILIFIAYIGICSLIPSVKRVFPVSYTHLIIHIQGLFRVMSICLVKSSLEFFVLCSTYKYFAKSFKDVYKRQAIYGSIVKRCLNQIGSQTGVATLI